MFENLNSALLWRSLSTLLSKLTGAAAAYALTIFIGRSFGAESAAPIYTALTFVVILSTVGRVGLDNTVVRFLSMSDSAKDREQNTSSVSFFSLCAVFVASSVTSLAFLLLVNFCESRGIPSEYYESMRFAILIVPLYSLVQLMGRLLQGSGNPASAVVVHSGLIPIMSLACLLFVDPADFEEFMFVYFSAVGLTTVIAAFRIRKYFKNIRIHFHAVNYRKIFDSCLPQWIVAILNIFVLWFAQFLLVSWATPNLVSQYAVAQRTAILISFVIIVLNTVSSPMFSRLYARGEIVRVKSLAAQVNIVAIGIGFPMLILVMIFSNEIMGFFGEGFESAASALQILAFGQFINIATGSSGTILSMSGNQVMLRNNVFKGAVLGVIVGLIAVPTLGVHGAAIATSVAISTRNILSLMAVKKILSGGSLSS